MKKTKKTWYGVALILCVVALLMWAGFFFSARRDAKWHDKVNHSDPSVRVHTLRTGSPAAYLEDYLAALNDENVDVRLTIVEKFSWGNAQDPRIAAALIRCFEDDRECVRRAAAWSLSWGGDEVWPLLRQALKHPSPRTRLGVVRTLWDFDRRTFGEESLPDDSYEELRKLDDDPDETVRAELRAWRGE